MTSDALRRLDVSNKLPEIPLREPLDKQELLKRQMAKTLFERERLEKVKENKQK